MKLWIFSDLHQDFGRFDMPIPNGVDIAVVAGDVQNDELLIRLGETLPTVYVAGNHDFYGHEYHKRLQYLRDLPSSQFYLLENDELVLGDVRFVGCTLWTDYDRGNPIAMDLARRSMNDHRKITWQKQPVWLRFRPQEAQMLHFQSKNWLSERLSEPFSGKTVVISHHAPSERSVEDKYASQMLNHAYFSALDAEIEEWRPSLWVHGHVHSNHDYVVGETRVICNPHGYPDENSSFNPSLVIEI
jgi:predicted phosphodiesterase